MISPVRLKCSGSSGPEGPESWAPLGEVAGQLLWTGRGCGCCPSGCGRGQQGAEARAWSPRCSPPGPPRPRLAPEPPGGSAPRPQAGGGCALSPRRGSLRLGTGAGVRGGDTGPHPLRSGISPLSGQVGPCVSPQISPPFLHSLPKPQKNFSGRTGQSADSFIPHLPMKNLHYQLPKYLPDSTSSHDPAQPLGSSPTNPAWSPPHAFVQTRPSALEALPLPSA